jgi:hypothetical protein
MSTLKTSPSHSPGKKKPYFMVREKRKRIKPNNAVGSHTKEQLMENLNNKSGEFNHSRITRGSISTKGTLIYKTVSLGT